MTGGGAPDVFGNYLSSMNALMMAPQKLWQSINSGWSFGNITVNAQNSSAPQAEMAIVSQHSYGRQIGRLLDAVCDLIEAQPGVDLATPAYKDLFELRDQIAAIKEDIAAQSAEQFVKSLDILKNSDDPKDRKTYGALIASLREKLA